MAKFWNMIAIIYFALAGFLTFLLIISPQILNPDAITLGCWLVPLLMFASGFYLRNKYRDHTPSPAIEVESSHQTPDPKPESRLDIKKLWQRDSSDVQPRPSVFISYRRIPSAMLATLIAKELDRQHIQVFVDTRQQDGAGPFPNRLLSAIETHDYFVCLVADTTFESEWVLNEIAYAHSLGKIMIPVFQENYDASQNPSSDVIEALLQYDGVKVLDRSNLYVDEAITQLIKMVKGGTSVPYQSPHPTPETSIETQMTLHKAIQVVLQDNHNNWMTAAQIAEEIGRRALYVRDDGASPPSSQVRAQIKTYPHLFETNRSQSPVRFRLHMS